LVFGYALTLIILLFPIFSNGQNKKIDSLRAVLKTVEGEQEYRTLNEITFHLFDIDNQEAFKFSERAFTLAYQYGDSLGIVKSGRRKGQLLRRIDRPNDALKVLLIVLPIAQRNKLIDEEGYILQGIAICYTFLAVYDKALEYNFLTLKLRELQKDTLGIASAFNNIGAVYYKIRNYDKAKDFFTKCLYLKELANDTYDKDRLLINLGLSNVHLKHFNEGLSLFRRAFNFCANNCSNNIQIEGKFGSAVAYLNLHDTLQAETLFQESLHLSELGNNKRFQAENLVYLGKIENGKRQSERAVKYLTRAEAIADSAHYNQLLMDIYRQSINAFTGSNDVTRSSSYRKKYITLKDSVVGENMVKSFSKIDSIIESSQPASDDKLKWIGIWVSIGSIAVLGFILLLIQLRRNLLLVKLTRLLSALKPNNL